MRAPIPQRVAPLAWRDPAFLWTPLGLAVAVGWPTGLFYNDPALQRVALVLGLGVFAVALASLGIAWALGRAPRTRQVVVLHVLAVATAAAVAAPFLLPELVADQAAAGRFNLTMALSMAPLALVLCLPIALISGVAFSWIALTRGRIGEGDLLDFRTSNVQPFR